MGPLAEGEILEEEGEILEEILEEEGVILDETPEEEAEILISMTNYQGNSLPYSKETGESLKHSYKNGISIKDSIEPLHTS